jgi:hypothetical protein
MTAEQPENQAMGVHSLEVRWIFPGPLETTVTEWFGRFAPATESREDTYLLDPRLPGLSVKIRGGQAFEVKVYHGSPGILDVAGRALGRMESWQKWSFPSDPPGQARAEPAGWRLVHKRRQISRFPLIGRRGRAGLPGPGEEPGCAVELTEIRMRGEAWWSLGLEAIGPPSLLHSELEATAALVLAVIPPGIELGTNGSKSYAEWLCQRPGTQSDAES